MKFYIYIYIIYPETCELLLRDVGGRGIVREMGKKGTQIYIGGKNTKED